MRAFIRAALATVVLGISSPAVAAQQTLAVCGPMAGMAFYPFSGRLSDKEHGWVKDAISSGRTTLVKTDAAKYDLLFLDATGTIKSAIHEGGSVSKVRQGAADYTFLVSYPGRVIEIYTFLVDKAGKRQVLYLTSKGADYPIHKGAIMVGECDQIIFD